MIEKIRKEYSRFIKKQFSKLFGEYDPELATNVWADIWKYYYAENLSSIDEKMLSLASNLDEESIITAKLIYDRYVFLVPCQKHKDSFLCKVSDFFTKGELDAAKENFYIDKEKYKLPDGIYYETSIFKYGHGIKLLPDSILERIKNKSIIDGGAFWGDSALVFNDFTDKKIYSFEPIKHNYEGMLSTIKLNNLENKIMPINKGLGEKSEEIELFPTDFCASVLVLDDKHKNYSTKIQTLTIDEFVEEQCISIGLIKLDIEGNELEAIKGALNTIKTQQPALLISIYHHPKDFFEIKPLLETLVPNYKFLIRKLNDFSPTYETMLIGYPNL